MAEYRITNVSITENGLVKSGEIEQIIYLNSNPVDVLELYNYPSAENSNDIAIWKKADDIYLVGVGADYKLTNNIPNVLNKDFDRPNDNFYINNSVSMLAKSTFEGDTVETEDASFNYSLVEGLGYIFYNNLTEWGRNYLNETIQLNDRIYNFREDKTIGSNEFLLNYEFTSKIVKLPSTSGNKIERLAYYPQEFDFEGEPRLYVYHEEDDTMSRLTTSNASNLTEGILSSLSITLRVGDKISYNISFGYNENTTSEYRDVCIMVCSGQSSYYQCMLHLIQEPANSKNIYYINTNSIYFPTAILNYDNNNRYQSPNLLQNSWIDMFDIETNLYNLSGVFSIGNVLSLDSLERSNKPYGYYIEDLKYYHADGNYTILAIPASWTIYEYNPYSTLKLLQDNIQWGTVSYNIYLVDNAYFNIYN